MAWSNMPVTEIGPSLVKVNTMGPLNSWSDEMRVHVVLWQFKTQKLPLDGTLHICCC